MHARRRLALVVLLMVSATARAQVASSVPATSMNVPQPSEISYSPSSDSGVSFIDSAVPRSMVRLRYDLGFSDHRPTRAEFLYAKTGVLGGSGMPLSESRVDVQELN